MIHKVTPSPKKQKIIEAPVMSTWYTRKEIESFKKDAIMVIRALKKQNLELQHRKYEKSPTLPRKTICKRGLEIGIEIDRHVRRKMLIRKVLKAQKHLEFSNNNEKEQYLAMISCNESYAAKYKALIEASLDTEMSDQNYSYIPQSKMANSA